MAGPLVARTTVKVAVQTGAAKDDFITGLVNEDSGSIKLNVLANDPGAARLWSLAQNVASLSGQLAEDPVGTTAKTALGATVTMNADGTISYDASGANLNHLAQGTSATDSFSYTIRMANGALSTATVNVQVAGLNDAPTLAPVNVASINDTAADDTPSAINGNLVGADVDDGAILTYGLASGVSGSSALGNLVVNADGSYSFQADANAIDALQAGETAQAGFAVMVRDEFGAAASVTLKFLLVGANDTAEIGGNGAGQVKEDEAASAAGALSIADRDHDQSAFQLPASLAGTYGDFTFDATGAWTYTLRNDADNVQSLAAGDSVTDVLHVASLDGSAGQDIVVNIAGTNDVASISGQSTGMVSEDAALQAGGKLDIADRDHDQSAFQLPASLAGTYGDFTFDAAGAWTYSLRNSADNVQSLAAGDSVSDVLHVVSLDGSASQDIVVAIAGTNDVAAISGQVTGSVTEDGILNAAGKLDVADRDHDQSALQLPASLAGAYGNFTFDQSGAWTYTLRNADANVQALNGGQSVIDRLLVSSLDGSATQAIEVTINGANEPVTNPFGDAVHTLVNHGRTIQNEQHIFNFDGNDVLDYVGGVTPGPIHTTTYEGKLSSAVEFTQNGNGNSIEVILVGYTGLTVDQLHQMGS